MLRELPPTPRSSASPAQTDLRELARAAVRAVGGQVLADTYADGVDYRLRRWPITCIGDVRVLDRERGDALVTARLTTASTWLIASGGVISLASFFAAAWLPEPAAVVALLSGVAIVGLTAVRASRGAPNRVRERLAQAVAHVTKSARRLDKNAASTAPLRHVPH